MRHLFALFTTALILFSSGARAQLRCYEFLRPVTGDWRDTTCVACTADPITIAEVAAELALPLSQRSRHINGAITGSFGGVNKNGAHQFLWHFKPNEWQLADLSMEVCDGRPYSDVDADTAYWIHNIGRFCPWGARVKREINTLSIGDGQPALQLSLYPNPVADRAYLVAGRSCKGYLQLTDVTGKVVWSRVLTLNAGEQALLDLGELSAGSYFLQFNSGPSRYIQRLSKL